MKPTYHPDADGLAFRVKVYSLRDDRGTPEQREYAFEQAQRLWWNEASAAAQRHGFSSMGCCGRSGGWAYPVPSVDPSDMDAETLARVEALGEDIMAMLREANDRFTTELDAVIAKDFIEGERLSVCEEQLAERMRTEHALLDAVREYVRAGHDVTIYRTITETLAAYDEARA